MLGVTFSMDEMAVHSKGRHVNKIRIMYKSEGGGLQTDAIFQKGYSNQIFMCNDPVSETSLAKSLLPIYARVVALLDNG